MTSTASPAPVMIAGSAHATAGILTPRLDSRHLVAYTSNMNAEKTPPAASPCLCFALRQASRAVSRHYDDELRGVGMRTTQYSLLVTLRRLGELRQRDLAEQTLHDETSLTRSLRPLVEAGWVAVRPGDDRREKLFRLTAAGETKLKEAQHAWERAQAKVRALLPEGALRGLMELLPEVSRLIAGS